MKRLITLEARGRKKKDPNDYPKIDGRNFLEFLLRRTNTQNISDLSTKIPYSQSYLNTIYNGYDKLTQSFVDKVSNEVGFTMNNYNDWIEEKGDGSSTKLKSKKRNDFDQVGFLKFLLEVLKKKAGIDKDQILNMLGLSVTFWNNMIEERRILSDDILNNIEEVFGINEASYELYSGNPSAGFDYITSKQIQELGKQNGIKEPRSKYESITKSNKFSKFLEEVTGLKTSDLYYELKVNPEKLIRDKETGKVAIPKDLKEVVQNILGLSTDQFKAYNGDPSSYATPQIQELQARYNPVQEEVTPELGPDVEQPEEQVNIPNEVAEMEEPKAKRGRKDLRRAPSDIDPTVFINFLLETTKLKTKDLASQLGVSQPYISNVKGKKIPFVNNFVDKVEEVFGFTTADYYGYVQGGGQTNDPSLNVAQFMGANEQQQYLNFICMKKETNFDLLATDLGYGLEELSDIGSGRETISQEFIDTVDSYLGENSMQEFEKFKTQGYSYFTDVTDYRGQGMA